MKQLAFFVDVEKCTGCKTCQIACKDLHSHPVGVNLRRVTEYGGGAWRQEGKTWRQTTFTYYLSVACNHCARPVCAAACPQKALKKRPADGLVILDQDLCNNCQACVKACPYGAPQEYEAIKKVVKCDGCLERVEKGAQPVCVEACTQRALDFGELVGLGEKHIHGDHIAPLPSPALTAPSLLLRAGRTARPIGDTQGAVEA